MTRSHSLSSCHVSHLRAPLCCLPALCRRLRLAIGYGVTLLSAAMAADGASTTLSQTPPAATAIRPWDEYRVILWMGDSFQRRRKDAPLIMKRLREMEVDSGMVYGGEGTGEVWATNGFPYYVENIVNRGLCLKWNAKVSDWDPFVTAWAKNREESAFVREYCLDDPAWFASAESAMRSAAQRHAAQRPLAYNIRDELSVTISANPFDYDFSPASLAGFRDWLQSVYGTFEALNAAWSTEFGAWEQVMPFSTDKIKNRLASGLALPRGKPDWGAVAAIRFDPARARAGATRWNFAPWADFRTYMDLVLARTLARLRDASHAVDPATPVGVEGTQMPHAFGGYDLERLSGALDWVEPYDIGNAREIFGSFMPGKTIMTTVFEKETAPASRRLWHLLLSGDKAALIWWSEDCLAWDAPELTLTAKARALAPVFRELKGPLARLFLRASPVRDPVALLYSQPSIQVDWLIESCVDGSTWHRRFSSFEADHNRMAKVRNAWLKSLQDLGFSPEFIGEKDLVSWGRKNPSGALILPTCRAMSPGASEVIRDFLRKPSADASRAVVLADGTPGLFDEHCRLLPRTPLDDLFPMAESSEKVLARCSGPASSVESWQGDVGGQGAVRLKKVPDRAWIDWLEARLASLPREVRLPVDARVRIHRYRLGSARLVAFERNIDYQMSEDLRQGGGNETLEVPVELSAKLDRKAWVYDLNKRSVVGFVEAIPFRLDPWKPSLFALLDSPPPEGADVVASLGIQTLRSK